MYYTDYFIGNKELGLNWTGWHLKCGFPEVKKDKYIEILISKGYKVIVVD